MGKATKTQRLREKVRAEIKHSKQSTLCDMPEASKEIANVDAPKQKKQIEINDINTSSREDELILEVSFRLLPSRITFSKVTADLYFDEQRIDSCRLRVLQGPLATNEMEFSSVLIMTGIERGQHNIRVEMYELWSSGEKLTCASRESTIEYIPVKKQDRLVKVPTVKSIAGADLAIISESEKTIYRELEEDMKKEAFNRRDDW